MFSALTRTRPNSANLHTDPNEHPLALAVVERTLATSAIQGRTPYSQRSYNES